MGVVKADAYGNGAIPVSNTLIKMGANWLGVALLEEGIELRQAGINKPILVMGIIPPQGFKAVVKYNLTATLCDLESALSLNQAAQQVGLKAMVHIKIDTGMSRIGILPNEVLPFVERIYQLANLEIQGIFTHFASADKSDKTSALRQLKRFQNILALLKERKINIQLKHIANSAAIVDLPQSHFDMVRLGIATYGVHPCENFKPMLNLRQSMTFKTGIIQLKKVLAGEFVSYGDTYLLRHDALLAVLPVGYADGYPRLLSNVGEVLVRGQRVPVLGRVCMDMTMIEVSQVPNIKIGDEVVLFGEQQGECIPVHEVAEKIQTISHEVMCGISKRVPRFYED
jgi:alanine racemase